MHVHTYLGFPEQGPREADQLPLPQGEVFAALADLVLDAVSQGSHMPLEVGQLQSSPDLFIVPLARRVQVESGAQFNAD